LKKLVFLSLILILVVAWGFAAADSVKRDIKAEEPSNLIRSQTNQAKVSAQQWYSIDPVLEAVVNKEVTDKPAEAELIRQAMPQEVHNKLRLNEITSDGIISEDEVDEYINLCSSLDRPDFPPVVMNTVSETEPNNDCGTANAIALGDTVYCAHLDGFGGDTDDYYTFTLDGTYTTWLLDVEGISGYDCSGGEAPWSLIGTVYNSDCSEVIIPPNGWGYPHFQYPVAPGTYVIQCHVYSAMGSTGNYHLTLNAGEYVGSPGDNCDNPLTISIPTALPYSDLKQTTCGKINDYGFSSGNCLGDNSGGEDIIYELNITSAGWYEFTLDPYLTTDIGLAVGLECPPISCVLNENTDWQGGIISQSAYLEIGTYFMMIDSYEDYEGVIACIDSFDISIDVGSPPLEGELCSWPITINNPLDYSDTRDLSLYANDYRSSGKDVVYTFTLEEPTDLRFSTCESLDEFHTVLWLYDSFTDCGDWNFIGYEYEAGCDLSDHVAFDYECEAGTYFLIVDADIEYYPEGSYTLVVEQFVPVCNDPEYVPPNDSCQQVTPVAITMSATETFTGNSCNSTQDNDYLYYDGVWVAFTTSEPGNLTLDFCNTVPTRHGCSDPLFTDCLGEAHLSPYTVDFEACLTSENPVLKYYNVPAGTYYYNVMNVRDLAEGPYVLDVTLEPTYELECPPGATDEGENLCLDFDDVYNGGCWADEPHFQAIDSGAVICGYTGNPGEWTRDWDYFEYVATDFRRLEFKVVMEAPVYISIRDGSNGCYEENILIEATEGAMDTAYLSYEVTPGTYWMTVSVDADNGWQCPIDYVAYFNPVWIEPYYCNPCLQYSMEYISQVDFNTISNSTGSEAEPCHYGDYTNMSTQVQQYGVYELSVQVVSEGSEEDVCAWIDWNQDFVFGEDETYYIGRGADFTPSIYIPVPGYALVGQTRMRVITALYNPWNPQPINPCPDGYDGEIEDYTVEVQAGLPAEFSVNPTAIDVEIDPRESATEVLTVSNTGDADLLFSAEVWMDPPAPADYLRANLNDMRRGGSVSIFDMNRDKPRSDNQPSEPSLILQGGDDISSAVAITEVPSTVSGTTVGFNDDYYEVCPLAATGGLDVVYSYTPTEDEWITLNLCFGETYFDTRMYVYENAETPGDPYRCNDDACYSPVYDEHAYISRISDMPVYSGNTYYIVVDGFNQDAYGNYVLDVIYGNPQTDNEECEDDGTLIYGQRPHSAEEYDWTYYPSDIEGPPDNPSFNYESYGGAWGEITGITFWGADARNIGWMWFECEAASEDFVVAFYADENGEPGELIYADTATVAGELTGIIHGDLDEKRYSMEFDTPVFLVSGWISILAISEPDNCWFYWLSSPEGDGMSIMENLSNHDRWLNDRDLSFCLRGTPMKWLTIDVTEGIVAPESSVEITVTLDASNLTRGAYSGAIKFETTDPANENATVPVSLAVTGCAQYLPGDVNMSTGAWPPAATSPDVTYLVNYFRGIPTSQSCKLDGYWGSADANGDCNIIGSDVTKLVNVFRGIGNMLYCADYEPCWLTPADFPEEAPSGWPNCETTTITKIIPPGGAQK